MDIWKIMKKWVIKAQEVFLAVFYALLKLSFVLLMIIYVFVGIGSLGVLAEKEYVKAQNISNTSKILNEAISKNDFKYLVKWIRFRDASDIVAISKIIEDKSGKVDPMVFFGISSKYFDLKNNEEAMFWFDLAQYRLRYDMLRCGASESIEVIGSFLNILYDAGIDDIKNKNADLVKNSLKRTIEFDKKYPPENDMEQTCYLIARIENKPELKIVSPEEWPNIRRGLIKSAEDFVSGKLDKKVRK